MSATATYCPYCLGDVDEHTIREVCTGACGAHVPPEEPEEREPERNERRTFDDMEDNVWE